MDDTTSPPYYELPAAPEPIKQHRFLRRLFINQLYAIEDFVDRLGFTEWLVQTHRTFHSDHSEEAREVHSSLFLGGSEWYGNPLLFAVENLFVRQANVFLDHVEATYSNWNYWSIRHTARYLSRFRIPGPDSTTIVRQRLAGQYGRPINLYKNQSQNNDNAMECENRYDDPYADPNSQ